MTIKFSKDHEWINAADANAAVVGITVHAQDALGDVVFVDLPAVGTRVHAIVRGKAVPMEVCATPFVPTRYYRG